MAISQSVSRFCKNGNNITWRTILMLIYCLIDNAIRFSILKYSVNIFWAVTRFADFNLKYLALLGARGRRGKGGAAGTNQRKGEKIKTKQRPIRGERHFANWRFFTVSQNLRAGDFVPSLCPLREENIDGIY
jgi:hypothetical protein